MKKDKMKRHHGKFVWKGFHNNVGYVWGYWTFKK